MRACDRTGPVFFFSAHGTVGWGCYGLFGLFFGKEEKSPNISPERMVFVEDAVGFFLMRLRKYEPDGPFI